MKLRIAKKIVAAVEREDADRYTLKQRWQAINRVERTASSRESDRCWNAMMRYFGPIGRAQILPPAMGLSLLMRTPESEWQGDPSAWPFVEAP